jgi:hypothetical protein
MTGEPPRAYGHWRRSQPPPAIPAVKQAPGTFGTRTAATMAQASGNDSREATMLRFLAARVTPRCRPGGHTCICISLCSFDVIILGFLE